MEGLLVLGYFLLKVILWTVVLWIFRVVQDLRSSNMRETITLQKLNASTVTVLQVLTGNADNFKRLQIIAPVNHWLACTGGNKNLSAGLSV